MGIKQILWKFKMNREKEKYTQIVKKWLEHFLKRKYSINYDIEVIVPGSNICRLPNPSIKKIKNYPLFDFKPDILGVLTNKKNSEVEFIFLNRLINAISIKDVGEMNVYSNLADPLLSFIISAKGLPSEVNNLLLNERIEESLLNYGNEKSIVLFRLLDNNSIDKKTIFPRRFKDFF